MKNAGWGVCGITLGVIFVIAVGALSVQAIGQEAGAVFDLYNTVIRITPPRIPLLPMLATATLSVLVMLFLTLGSLKMSRRSRQALVAGFFLTAALLITWALLLTAARRTGDITLGVLPGWKGWLEKGGRSSAVHVVTLLSVGSLWCRFGSQQTKSEPDHADTPAHS